VLGEASRQLSQLPLLQWQRETRRAQADPAPQGDELLAEPDLMLSVGR